MSEFVEKEKIEKFIEDGLNNKNKLKAFGNDAVEIMAFVHYMPSIDARSISHEKWEKDIPMGYRCSAIGCGCLSVCKTNYCPNCGAKMDAE